MKSVVSSALLLALPVFALPSSLHERQDACKALPANYAYSPASSKLPDPFTFADGTKVTTKAQWACRKQEILQLFYLQELGDKPAKPESVTGTVSATSISVKVTNAGKSISFSATVKMPSGVTGAAPAIIAYGGASLPIPAGVATITFNNDGVAQQTNSGSRGKGLFYDLYGSGHSAGATTAWAWGVSRILDVIEADTTKKIDVTRIGVTGCSRNGKGALIAGALDDRIALTLPQESGSGGAACWRISDLEEAAGKKIQTAHEIIGENVWYSKRFDPFATKTSTLAVDHHMLPALIAPRGLLVIENNIDWLGPVSTTGCMRVGALAYQALGATDSFGFSEVAPHNHCTFPSSQQTELTAFINRFLKGDASAKTAGVDKSDQANVKASTYITWTAPTLT
ncbi:hypothetical protein GLAREA_02289 [Glarea lozoyensis ATCC 20868]|uniref:(4-O-methyl)-D-glucuronate--lignin esterase n=2 Tax=Glarea lozoyensis TaxID=101852 RepID=S3CIR1_GLAL2|nr:uncharacterized protein GLAREA_02289 [Glarea lozoyensis ATCC 20868]EHL02818.1 hypothetical protein M7I_1080 [Glarea lozoyensis 74030]EPE26377.1 hypothetical protein GLAREA_02289 [Glarea lozoyensis ATCC 20868]